MGKYGPPLSHLFFADDCLLFLKDSVESIPTLLHVLTTYEKVLGQKINVTKSSIFFAKSMNEMRKQAIVRQLHMPRSSGDGRYLGLPYLVGRSKREIFQYLKDRIWKKAHGWKEKLLSHGGKEILIKAVLQAIPTFAMSVFKLPLRLCCDIQAICRKFWWKSVGDERSTSWIAWDTICRPKRNGGLGFKHIPLFNQALLAKQAWRIFQYPGSLVSQILKAKYFPHHDFLQVSSGQTSS
uniref:BZIP-like protein n=1 Tax=Gossypium hirsutum TaxID=3635 RepID=Q4ZJA9_GOSHI|nr:bZIP-like protein [Gossypium hirsutum]